MLLILSKKNYQPDIDTIKTKVTNVFGVIKDKVILLSTPTRDKLKEEVEKIKSFFDFKIQLPKIKTPSVTVTWKTGALAEVAQFIGLKGIPKFYVAWDAKGGDFLTSLPCCKDWAKRAPNMPIASCAYRLKVGYRNEY